MSSIRSSYVKFLNIELKLFKLKFYINPSACSLNYFWVNYPSRLVAGVWQLAYLRQFIKSFSINYLQFLFFFFLNLPSLSLSWLPFSLSITHNPNWSTEPQAFKLHSSTILKVVSNTLDLLQSLYAEFLVLLFRLDCYLMGVANIIFVQSPLQFFFFFGFSLIIFFGCQSLSFT